MALLWFLLASGAAIMWGINYTIVEKILHGGVSLFFLLFLYSCLMMVISLGAMTFSKGNVIAESWQHIQSNKVPLWMIVTYTVTAFVGWFVINMAVQHHNATAVSMVEITYPFFVILFTWLFFREAHINPAMLAGAFMILCGSCLLLWKG